MKIRIKLLIVAALLSLLFGFGASKAFAHCGECGIAEAEAAETVTFQAKVICLGCTLKKEQSAKAQCSLYGHTQALMTEDDKIWTILENDTSTELINSHEYKGKKVEITGKKFIGTQIIEIESFKVIE